MVAGKAPITSGFLTIGGKMPSTNKSLGQHWLHDKEVLYSIANDASLKTDDFVVEIGPGLGTLTDVILETGAKVLAIEFDEKLATKLHQKYKANSKIQIVSQDILKFNFSKLNKPYKIVANIPYYLTSHLVRILAELKNPPLTAVLLVQKEVAQRIASDPGAMSKLSVFAQNVFQTSLGTLVTAEFFTPPPKVDSQVIILHKREECLVPAQYKDSFDQLVTAGFSEKRKKLRSSLSGGLGLDKKITDDLLVESKVDPDSRAQGLTIDQWIDLAKTLSEK